MLTFGLNICQFIREREVGGGGPTLFNKNTAYADLVVSWPSKNRGNSIVFMLVLGCAELTTEVIDDGSTAGA